MVNLTTGIMFLLYMHALLGVGNFTKVVRVVPNAYETVSDCLKCEKK
jgi:hypothetical protein